MTQTFQLQFDGTDKLAANLRMAKENMSAGVAQAMVDFGGHVEGIAVERTPVDTGELRARSFVEGALYDESSKSYTVVVGYEKYGDTLPKTSEGKPDRYAVPVHERFARHEVGQRKFLESAFQDSANEYLSFMAEVLRKEVFRT